MFYVLIVALITWLYKFMETPPIHLKWMNIVVCKLHHNKAD